MNKKSFIICLALNCVGIIGTAVVALMVGRKKTEVLLSGNENDCKSTNRHDYNSSNQENDAYDYMDDSICAVYSFSNSYDMYCALQSQEFNTIAYYDLEGSCYVMVLLDGNEDKVEKYGGMRLKEEEIEDFIERKSVKTQYIAFYDKENYEKYIKAIQSFLNEQEDFKVIQYDLTTYMNFENIDSKLYMRLKNIASEFYGIEVTDMYIANTLRDAFDGI